MPLPMVLHIPGVPKVCCKSFNISMLARFFRLSVVEMSGVVTDDRKHC
jgi:hypothetical protein